MLVLKHKFLLLKLALINLTKATQYQYIWNIGILTLHLDLPTLNTWVPTTIWSVVVRCWPLERPPPPHPLLLIPGPAEGNCLNWPNHKFLQIIQTCGKLLPKSGPPGTLAGGPINLSGACRAPHKILPTPPLLLNSIIITSYYPHWRRDGSIPTSYPNIRITKSRFES